MIFGVRATSRSCIVRALHECALGALTRLPCVAAFRHRSRLIALGLTICTVPHLWPVGSTKMNSHISTGG